MSREEAVDRLRAVEPRLRALGIDGLSLFGSTARGEAREDSDLDLVIRLRPDVTFAWGWFWIEDEVADMLGVPVDMVAEPTHRPRFQAEIDRDRVHVF